MAPTTMNMNRGKTSASITSRKKRSETHPKLHQEDVSRILKHVLEGEDKHFPDRLQFKIVLPHPTAKNERLSPPQYEYPDGLYAIMAPAKWRRDFKLRGRKVDLTTEEYYELLPPYLRPHVANDLPEPSCDWSLSGPQFPKPTAIQQRYCYPSGREDYEGSKGASLWTVFSETHNEIYDFRLLHVYYSTKRAKNRGRRPRAQDDMTPVTKAPPRKKQKQQQPSVAGAAAGDHADADPSACLALPMPPLAPQARPATTRRRRCVPLQPSLASAVRDSAVLAEEVEGTKASVAADHFPGCEPLDLNYMPRHEWESVELSPGSEMDRDLAMLHASFDDLGAGSAHDTDDIWSLERRDHGVSALEGHDEDEWRLMHAVDTGVPGEYGAFWAEMPIGASAYHHHAYHDPWSPSVQDVEHNVGQLLQSSVTMGARWSQSVLTDSPSTTHIADEGLPSLSVFQRAPSPMMRSTARGIEQTETVADREFEKEGASCREGDNNSNLEPAPAQDDKETAAASAQLEMQQEKLDEHSKLDENGVATKTAEFREEEEEEEDKDTATDATSNGRATNDEQREHPDDTEDHRSQGHTSPSLGLSPQDSAPSPTSMASLQDEDEIPVKRMMDKREDERVTMDADVTAI